MEEALSRVATASLVRTFAHLDSFSAHFGSFFGPFWPILAQIRPPRTASQSPGETPPDPPTPRLSWHPPGGSPGHPLWAIPGMYRAAPALPPRYTLTRTLPAPVPRT